MAKIKPFENYPSRYERWFDENKFVYESELRAVGELLPESGKGVEIGVGGGRFAIPFGIEIGLEPSSQMRKIAEMKGIKTVAGVAEELPFDESSFDYALMVATICFVDSLEMSFREAYKILKLGGVFVVGFIDKNSPVGKSYQKHKDKSVFYSEAVFYSTQIVASYLEQAGFRELDFRQTIFKKLSEIKDIEPVKKGFGEGSFVAVKAVK